MFINSTRQSYLLLILLISGQLLSSCGGGDSQDTNYTPEIIVGNRVLAGTFNYYAINNDKFIVRYIYPIDLNADGIEEVIFAGFESAPNTPVNYTNTNIYIFGWNNQQLVDITSQWLPGSDNQVEGVGDIAFGDFDNNGNIDVYLTGYSDMDHPLNAFALMSNGASFTKTALGTATWEHGATSADINNDGYDDVFVAGGINPSYFYLGGDSGLTRYSNPSYIINTSGSGIAVADFLGTGNNSIIISDRSGETTPQDTILYTVTLDTNAIPSTYVEHSKLPEPRIETLHSDLDSHDIRVRAFDFTQDGLDDAIVFSRPWNNPSGNEWEELSEMQFLQNNGNGQFEDVTNAVRVNYKKDSSPSYNPVFNDFNGDGRTDIFISDATFSTAHDSTSILLQTDTGTFVDTGRTDLSSKVAPAGGIASMIKGPNGDFYLITEESKVTGGVLTSNVNYAKISWP